MVRFDHWGAANCGLQLGENLTGLYAARPPLRAVRIGALISFIPPHVQAFRLLSSVTETIPAVSSSPSVRSDYEYFILRNALDGFLGREASKGSHLSLKRFRQES